MVFRRCAERYGRTLRSLGRAALLLDCSDPRPLFDYDFLNRNPASPVVGARAIDLSFSSVASGDGPGKEQGRDAVALL